MSSTSVGQETIAVATDDKVLRGETSKSAISDVTPGEPKIKLVTLRKFGESPNLVGEIDLGHIPSGVPLEVDFQLENKGSKQIQIRGVNSSCTCTKVVLPQMDLAEGEKSNSTGHISIKSPKSRGQVVLGSVQLLESTDSPAIAVLTVKAFVERPFSLSSSYYSLGVDANGIVDVPVDVDPKIDTKEIVIGVDHPRVKTHLERNPTNGTVKLRLSGNRDELIAAKRVIVDVGYQSIKEPVELRDTFTVEFFDSLACRVVPSSPKIVDGKISFMLFRKDSFDTEKLRCTPLNCDIDCRFVSKSDKIVSVNGTVSNVSTDARIEISDGSFSVTIPLATN